MRGKMKLLGAGLFGFLLLPTTRGQDTEPGQEPVRPPRIGHEMAGPHPDMTTSTTIQRSGEIVTHTTMRQSNRLVAPVIDGAETPELISDEAALRLLFTAIAIPPNPAPEVAARSDRRIRAIGLDAADQEILRQEMRLYHTLSTRQLQRIASVREAGRHGGPAVAAALKLEDAQLTLLAVNAYDTLLSALTPSGAASLQAHVAEMKPRIKIIPPPDMSTH